MDQKSWYGHPNWWFFQLNHKIDFQHQNLNLRLYNKTFYSCNSFFRILNLSFQSLSNISGQQLSHSLVRRIIKTTTVTAQLNEEFGNCPRLFISYLIDVVFVLFIWFIWNTRVSISNVHFPTHAISKSLQHSVSHSINMFLSVSLYPFSAYSQLYLFLIWL